MQKGGKSNNKEAAPGSKEKKALPLRNEVREAKPYSLIIAWGLTLFCVYLTLKCILDIILEQAAFPPLMMLMALSIVIAPALIIAEMMGTRYTISLSHIEQRGFFGFCKQFAWEEITKIVLCSPRSFLRDIFINAGRKRIVFGAGFFWWRPGFFKAAESAVAIAESKGIPVRLKGMFFERDGGDLEKWFELGREGLFWWSKAQLPPKSPPEK